MSEPIVDILMPAYNAEATIRQAVDSLRNQTRSDIRIVVVDDGSRDGTGRILAELAAEDPRVVVLTQPNGGIVAALTRGMAACSAPFLARLDADDMAAPDRLERQLRHMAEQPDCVALSGSGGHMDAQGRPTGGRVRLARVDRADPAWVPAREPYLPAPFLLIRRAAFDRVGGYRPLVVAEDSDLYWRLSEIGTLRNIDENFGNYRVHAASISSASIRNGRSLAFWSQIAALSARRRRAGQPDLDGIIADAHRYASAVSLQDFHRAAAPALTDHESTWLALAMGMKLVTLAFYRPYELEAADCLFIRDALRAAAAGLPAENRAEIADHLLGTATRLAIRGRVGDALKLVSPGRYPALLGRISFRLALPDSLRNRVKKAAGRAQPA
ncbi:glycosyltransferase family A protein [Nguyenibacter sp. L1]|uniref:glycosyltransferase family 2 protein n=1 Tax=Nguyenibacter sp. L1 TaxID=3049350 RepID=UPI002B493AEA|nr:glycosyltransferase family A protein [Nguyenibacter sp. L1]WRH88732.1 glycosyltransferase family A protein [Nguyenibacter sp. L1]